jgi:hypothetical protein
MIQHQGKDIDNLFLGDAFRKTCCVGVLTAYGTVLLYPTWDIFPMRVMEMSTGLKFLR